MRVVLDPLAKREFDEARDHYNQQQPGLGAEFQEAVKDSLRRLREWPESGAVELQDVRRAVLRRFPYKLLYAVRPDLFVCAGQRADLFHGLPAPWPCVVGICRRHRRAVAEPLLT